MNKRLSAFNSFYGQEPEQNDEPVQVDEENNQEDEVCADAK